MSGEGANGFARTTTLGAAEYLSRLEQAGRDDEWSDTLDPDASELRIEISGRRFLIRNAVDGSPPQALRRVFDGEVVEQPVGSIVRGRFRLHTMTRAALTLWFVSMSLVLVLIAAGNVNGGVELPPAASGWVGMGIPAVMMGAAALLVRSSLAQSRRLEEDVTRFLSQLAAS